MSNLVFNPLTGKFDIVGNGVPGPQGIQGVPGEKGDKGDKGDQGIQGIQGLQGEKGDQGAQGVQGVQGLKGDKGDKGDQGIQGLQGLQGIQGEKGDQGAQGVQGLKGDKGDKGDQGIQGIQGLQGIQGEKGDPGEAGSDASLPYKTIVFSFSASLEAKEEISRLSFFQNDAGTDFNYLTAEYTATVGMQVFSLNKNSVGAYTGTERLWADVQAFCYEDVRPHYASVAIYPDTEKASFKVAFPITTDNAVFYVEIRIYPALVDE